MPLGTVSALKCALAMDEMPSTLLELYFLQSGVDHRELLGSTDAKPTPTTSRC